MSWLVPIALVAWFPVVLALFALLPPRRAVLVSYIAGWLFLPVGAIVLPIIPDYTKHAAIAIPTLIASLLFDGRTWSRVRPKWVDLPMAAFCLAPFVTCVLTAHGPVAGISRVLRLRSP